MSNATQRGSGMDQITNQLDNNPNITNNHMLKIEAQTERFSESEEKRDDNDERRNTSTNNLILEY